MEEIQLNSDRLPFQPVLVGKCYAQMADDRFGKGASKIIHQRERSVPLDDELLDELVPTLQDFRNNLTALSHLYNARLKLYLVAYQGQIFVYLPRNIPKQTISRHPDLILAPRQSEVGRLVRGYVDPAKAHTINHIIVGELGNEEIVVASYDDGDVTAYLTRALAYWITRRAPPSGSCAASPMQHWDRQGSTTEAPRPFFHDNAGKSAWGLAVHSRSRLISVSSNLFEVTVSALALTATGKDEREEDICLRKPHQRKRCAEAETHVRQRARSWRIVIRLGIHADNLPNVCFIDDDDGLADLVCAVDIQGSIWLANIWKTNQAAIRIEPVESDYWATSDMLFPRGWGILALSKADFLLVGSVEELVGTSGKEVDRINRGTVNVQACLQNIPDNPNQIEAVSVAAHPMVRGAQPVTAGQASDMSPPIEEENSEQDEAAEESNTAESTSHASEDVGDWESLNMARTALTGQPQGLAQCLLQAGNHGCEARRDRMTSAWPKFDMAYYPDKGVMMLTPQESDNLADFLTEHPRGTLELRGVGDEDEDGARRELVVMCPRAVHMSENAMSPTARRLFWEMSRLNMVVHVPELSLVVVGSAIGRVLLVTPMRLAKPTDTKQGVLEH